MTRSRYITHKRKFKGILNTNYKYKHNRLTYVLQWKSNQYNTNVLFSICSKCVYGIKGYMSLIFSLGDFFMKDNCLHFISIWQKETMDPFLMVSSHPTLKVDRPLGVTGAEVPVKFQNSTIESNLTQWYYTKYFQLFVILIIMDICPNILQSKTMVFLKCTEIVCQIHPGWTPTSLSRHWWSGRRQVGRVPVI